MKTPEQSGIRPGAEGSQDADSDPTEALNRYAGIFAHTPDPVSLINRDYVYLLANNAFCTAHSLDAADIIGKRVPEVWGEGRFNDPIKGFLDRCLAGEVVHYSGMFPFGSLGPRFMSVTYYPYYNSEGQVAGSVVSSRDISDLKQAADDHEESEARYRALFESSGDALLVFDNHGRILEANRIACSTFGYAETELLGSSITRLLSDEHMPQLLSALHSALSQEQPGAESTGERHNGENFPVDIRLSAVRYRDQRVFLAAVRDVTEAKRAQQEIAYLARHDAITGLPNRTHFFELLEAALARAIRNDRWVALLYVDLDGFKPVNDNHGHHAGDQLLALVAARFQEAIRDVDSVARIGGDEFAVLLEGIAAVSDCFPVANKLLDSLRSGIRIQDIDIRVSASIGVAIFPQHGTDPELLIRRGDRAMYEAKHNRDSFQVWSSVLED